MRRKVHTKDQILEAAYDAIAKRGFKGFTVRNIAKKAGIPTQSIYLEFENMRNLKNTLLDSIFERLKEGIFPIKCTGGKIIDFGLSHIYFAKKHHSLYMVLYADEHGDGEKMHDFSYNYFHEIAKEDERYNQLSDDYIDALHTGIWVAVTGSASLMSSDIMHPTEKQIIVLVRWTIDSILALDSPKTVRQCSIMMDLIGKSVSYKLPVDFFCKKTVSVIYLLGIDLTFRGKGSKMVLVEDWRDGNTPDSKSGEPQ